jgi:hypothetical protein
MITPMPLPPLFRFTLPPFATPPRHADFVFAVCRQAAIDSSPESRHDAYAPMPLIFTPRCDIDFRLQFRRCCRGAAVAERSWLALPLD